MSAEEALAYGLIDEIVQPNDEKIRQLSLPPPSQSPELFSEIPKSAIDYEFGKLVCHRKVLLNICELMPLFIY
jgi:hypothetical protein